MYAEDGAKWNFACVLPQCPGRPIYLVVPTSLQIGWVESPPFFCAASETARDVAQDYSETRLGTLLPHKFTKFMIGNQDYGKLPEWDEDGNAFQYSLRYMLMTLSALLSQPLASSHDTSAPA
jgi:hypothetical protein